LGSEPKENIIFGKKEFTLVQIKLGRIIKRKKGSNYK